MRRIKYFKTIRSYIDNVDWLHEQSVVGDESYNLWLKNIVEKNNGVASCYGLLLSGYVQDEKYINLDGTMKKFNKGLNYYPQFKHLNFEN